MNTPENVFSKFADLKAIDVTDEDQFKSKCEEMLMMDLSTQPGVDAFIENRDIIERHIETESCESYFLMNTDVANEDWKKRHEHFEKVIKPLYREYTEKLNKKFLESEVAQALPAPFDVLRRKWNAEVELFRQENVPLLKEVDSISMEITEINGKLTARWEGEDVPVMVIYDQLKKTDRSIREEAYESLKTANLSIADILDKKFCRLMELRHKIGTNAGFESYTGYRFKEFMRFDWGPDDCFAFHQAVKKHLLPLQGALVKRRKKGLKLDTLRPYDGACDRYGREPLRIYEKGDSQSLVNGTEKIIEAIDPELLGYFKRMRDDNLFDLDARKNKAPGGFMCMYPVYEQASVFWNGTGFVRDLFVLLHELGHCFHYFLGKEVYPFNLQDWTCEVAEVGSMSMEYIGMEEVENYLPKEQADRVKEDRLSQVVGLLLQTAKGDEFQHWMYSNPNHSMEDRHQKWLDLTNLYSPGFDRSGYEDYIAKTGWQFLHILQSPFYLIDYSISELMALTIWDRYKDDPVDAIQHYKQGCSLSGSRPVPEIYESFGSKFGFGEEKIAPLAKRLAAELERGQMK